MRHEEMENSSEEGASRPKRWELGLPLMLPWAILEKKHPNENKVHKMRVGEKETHAGSMVTAMAHAREGFHVLQGQGSCSVLAQVVRQWGWEPGQGG